MEASRSSLPHWDLSNVYPGLESREFVHDFANLETQLADLEDFVAQNRIGKLDAAPTDFVATGRVLEETLQRLNDATLRRATLSAYISSFASTDSYNTLAARRTSELEQTGLRLRKAYVRFEAWIGSLGFALDEASRLSSAVADHRGVLDRIVEQSRYLMDARLEDLASELSLSGGGSMWKLHVKTTTQLKMEFTRGGTTERLPMTVLRNLANDPDPDLRRRAYETELRGWESIREPVAFALNCVKGAAVTLAKWRGRDDVLHEALDQNRIDREILGVLHAAMRESFPTFRRYLHSKAEKLGQRRLPWWDLLAPVGRCPRTFTWPALSDYVIEQFSTFSGELADLARRAFANRWIDAEPRDGKRGGAFCMKVPAVEESRILTNFDGSFDQLLTISHELGHAYHNHCQRGLPMLRRGAPMALAETASIFCETLVLNKALEQSPEEVEVTILENQLIGACQVIVDMYGRFLFESEVCRRRAAAELSADEMCAIMLDAQRQTYGDALDPEHLHPYMWLLKPHYYFGDLHFYNFPYAFGFLFGLGIYAIYRREGKDFVPRYNALLRSTGSGKVADLAGRLGIDVRSPQFWNGSLAIIAERVDRYCALKA